MRGGLCATDMPEAKRCQENVLRQWALEMGRRQAEVGNGRPTNEQTRRVRAGD
jgi:hypothetical protein